ncbi:putative aldouronate transport system permease protein [Paenibacillus sp. UNC496MF]|uniref:carbohydrate ABC transporter permease n=1 Tax=Paenibacillus sp. UNC496MF TaxID=1502753 RepID=UPI0008E13EA9|nr:carbohydrate ABC transporter permease [Paenibacillus sp. UNC496MF]SFJ55251.1 putative aldouronate transport system permease protein [Paenibacillus sp. UNC496MF]
MKERWGSRAFNAGNLIVLAVLAAVTLFPIYYVFVISFVTPEQYYRGGLILFPEKWTLESYRYLLSTGSFVRASGVSAFLATAGTACSLIVTASFAYALSRKRMPCRKTLLLLVLLTTLLNPGIIPHYLLVRDIGLINSLWSLIVPSLTSGWYIFLMKGFFDSVPASLEEAAKIDGSSDIGVWAKIILPLSMPSIAAVGLFYAVGYWNTFFNAVLYINDAGKYPLQVLLQNMLIDSSTALGGDGSDLSLEKRMPPEMLKMAAVIVATVPILFVYPFLQKHFTKGVMLGSVKE